jgi:phosphatidate cytidylyltransferase
MTRVLSGATLLLLVILAVWFAPAVLFLVIAEALLLLACIEYASLSRNSGLSIPFVATWAAAAVTCALFARTELPGALNALSVEVTLMVASLVLSTIVMVRWQGGHDALGNVCASLFPSLYLGLPIGAMVAVREVHGREVLFLLMLTVVVSDTAQYYTGRAFGRHPLAATISPKKTVEGAIGGFVFGAALLAWLGTWWLPGVPALVRALLGTVIVAVGIAGDLFESMLKRSAGVKDSSALIPGHGGILDRIDALLFAAPVYYVALKYLP